MYIAEMSKQDSNQNRTQNRSWAAPLLPLLAAMSLAVVGRISLLENSYYDHLQKRQFSVPSEEIVLITVNPRLDDQTNIWTATGFLTLAKQLNAAGARVIVPTQPLRFPEAPSLRQILALEALQARVGQTEDMDVNPLIRDLPLLKARYKEREQTFQDYQSINNIVLAAELTDSYSSGNSEAPACNKFSAQYGDIDTSEIRRSRNIVLPDQEICKSLKGVGFGSFYADNDDVVRESNLLINANGSLHSSLALATLAAVERVAVNVDSANAIRLNQQNLSTNTGFTILNQFYALDGENSLHPISYNEALANPSILEKAHNKIVLIGEAEYTGIQAYKSPISGQLTPLQMTGTSLSNLLQKNYITRPDWLPLAETLLLVALVAGCLTFLPRMGWLAALTVGIAIGVMLLMLEAWLVTQQLIWVQLATTATYVTLAVFVITSVRRVNRQKQFSRDIGIRTLMAQSSNDSLDVQFSVLRQKQPNAINKRKIYDIVTKYEQSQEFAKAENALKYLSKADPDYMDVAEKLHRISGATQKRETAQEQQAAAHQKSAASGDTSKALGRYEIVKILGRGAMSTVYLGLDSKIQRKVAIKTIALADEFDDLELSKAREQFLREAESAGRLNHPYIIAIYDIGEDQGVAYLAMEYFSGVSLIDYADSKRLLPPVRVLQLMARAAEALDYAHSQNVVHRDVKPTNILYDAATDRLKITDFGIARLTDTSRTKTGIILGTPAYMSPEQLSASGVTGQSDLYSLGVTLYHLLTGAPPFRADSIPQLMDKIVHDNPTSVTKVRADLPDCLNTLINKALAKNPQDRFPNGKAMALALLACSKQVQI
jgi:eukaryotic-like serine/threonine-protein kinase